jgi:hypothetical protein
LCSRASIGGRLVPILLAVSPLAAIRSRADDDEIDLTLAHQRPLMLSVMTVV